VAVSTGNTPAVDEFTAVSVAVMLITPPIAHEANLRI
jgi:hypothetical protein